MALPALTDAELIARIAARDVEAGAELFDRYANSVFRFLRRRVRPGEAEDLLQEVFVRALRGASSFRGESSVRTWLYSIARYAAMEHTSGAAASLDGLVDPAPGPESLALCRERLKGAIAALERLPDEQALVVELHRIDGLSHEEIGRLLGISPSASRKRLQRAARALRGAQPEPDRVRPTRHSRIESWRRSLLLRTVG